MKLKAFTYSFPFKKPFITGSGTFTSREGMILELNEENITALGEAAPLPGFSKESLQDVLTQLKNHAGEIEEIFSQALSLDTLQIFHRKNEILPSLQFALDTLAVDYLSQKSNVAAQNFLFDDPATSLQLNGVVSMSTPDKTLKKVDELIEQGFLTIKIKVGKDFESELANLKKIQSAYPKLSLRLDANKAWELNEASQNLGELHDLNIEYCEEPLGDPTLQNFKKLKDISPIPIALDESLHTIKNPDSIMPHISAVVIKPMVVGSLSKLFATNRLADSHNNKVIYTTSLESGIGRTMTVILAAGLGNKNSAHGLATGSLLKMDVWNDGTYINNGSVYLPDRSELGQRYHSNHKNLEPVRIDL